MTTCYADEIALTVTEEAHPLRGAVHADDAVVVGVDEAGVLDNLDPVSYTHLTLPTTPYV